MYVIEFPNGQKVEISNRTFNAIKRFHDGKITRTQYQSIVRKDTNLIKYNSETKVPWASIYQWLLWAYENHKYSIKTVTWYKVLATVTFRYSGKNARELEGRLLIDITKEVYETQKKKFFKFCEEAIELFFELAGYSVEFIMSADKYVGYAILNQFEDTLNRVPKFYIEIYDGDYGRFPFHAEGKLPRQYWRNWRNAIMAIYEEMERNIIHEWNYHSGVREHAKD